MLFKSDPILFYAWRDYLSERDREIHFKFIFFWNNRNKKDQYFKMKNNFLFFAVVSLSCLAAVTYAQCTYYTLQYGQTFVSLANGNTNLFNQLVAYNPSVNPYVYAGNTTICIPTAYFGSYYFSTSTTVVTTSCASYYTIKAGINLIFVKTKF